MNREAVVAKKLDCVAKNFKNNIDKVVYLKVPDKESLWRIAHRGDSTRADESLPALKKRIELFHKYTEPVLDHYEKEGKLAVVDGTSFGADVSRGDQGSGRGL